MQHVCYSDSIHLAIYVGWIMVVLPLCLDFHLNTRLHLSAATAALPQREARLSGSPQKNVPSLLILQVNMLWPLHVPLVILAW